MNALVMLLLTATPLVDPQFLREYAETRRYLAGRPAGAKVTPDGKAVLFLRSQPKDARQMLYELDVATGVTRERLTPDAVLKGAAEKLSVEEKARLERQRVTVRGFVSFQLSEDGKRILLGLSGRLYVVERATNAVTELKTGPGPSIDPRFSRDGRLVGYVRDDDVHVLELATNTERRVTRGGTELKPHGLAEFVAQEEMSRFSGYWFSPDGATLAFQETDHAGVERFGIADPLHPEQEPNRFFYPRAGRANAQVRLGLTPTRGGKVSWVEWDRAAFPYLATVRWPKQGALTILVQNREQTKEQLLAVDPRTGKTKLLLTDEDPAWLNLNQEFPHWLDDGSGFFWGTEANGGPEVQLRQADGSLEATWVKPEAGYADLVGWHQASRTLYFSGGPNPTETALYRVRAGGAPERLATPLAGPGLAVGHLSEDGSVLLATVLGPQAMPSTYALTPDGAALAQLPSVALEPSLKCSREVLKLDGEPGSWASVIRPKDFVKGRKYPVILQVYGGPGHTAVSQSMALEPQWLANQGFLVVQLDGRGTPRRGRDWERAIRHDFATLIAADQVAGLKALAAKLPELDLARVGVEGWSFGGYLTALLTMTHGELFRSGVAGAPVVDWQDYDTHYTERYLGLPQADPKAYQVASLLTYVPQAKSPLLLIHGTADDNVYFLHTLKLSDALFRAGKPHAVLPLSNFTHMVPEPQVTERLDEKIVTWFKETL